VLRVRFEGGRVWVSQRFLQSGAYKAASAGTMRFREFNTAPTHSSALGKAREVAATVLGAVGVGEGLTDNASVNVVPFGDRTALALTETASGAYLVDADTLATKERLTLQPGDGMPGSLTTAHPCVQRDGALLNFVTEVGLGLSLYRMRPVQRSPARRELVARVALAEPFAPSWMHDFAATENHALLCEWPIRFDMSRMLLGNGSAPTPFDWRGDAPTRLHLVRLSDGNVDTYELPAAFAFHFAGAHEDGEHLHVFGAVCEDPQIVEALALDRCRAAPGEPEHKPIPVASLRRISVPLRRAPGARATMTEVSPPAGKRGSGFAEFPCVNETWRDFGRSAVRYVWALHAIGGSNLGNALVKVDTRDRTAKVWRRPDFIPGEPIFVPRPDGEAEDDGVLMACTHGPDGKASFVVLDASTMEELASCEADVTLGYGFHGTMLSDV
jgi:carlactone synthase/all-trans-10'-apo-beta-carotenal 13,14-cleaving dioxygenase